MRTPLSHDETAALLRRQDAQVREAKRLIKYAGLPCAALFVAVMVWLAIAF